MSRLGFGIGNEKLIADLNTVKYSTNPYNVNRLTAAAGVAALTENEYYMNNCCTIADNRAWTVKELTRLGFEVLDSKANFVFAKSERVGGQELYEQLKARGVLVRHFTKPRIAEYNRITIGTMEQMQILVDTIECILEG